MDRIDQKKMTMKTKTLDKNYYIFGGTLYIIETLE